jgi:hypothetical protein
MDIEGVVGAIDRVASRVEINFGPSRRWFDVPDQQTLATLQPGFLAAISVDQVDGDICLTVQTPSGSLWIVGDPDAVRR